MFLSVVVKDLEKAGEAIANEIKALPSQVEHVAADIFKFLAKQVGPEVLKSGVQLAEHYVTNLLPKAQGLVEGEVAKLTTAVEHTDAFAWVKGELLTIYPTLTLPDAHVAAAAAWALVNRGISIVAGAVQAGETDAIGQ